jgi:CPA2 family monovalent cation:H+ antiporter-2
MLLDPGYLIEAPGLIASALAVVLVGKPLAALIIVRLLGHPFRVALAIAIALAQIGEFSFILSRVGIEYGILTAAATNTLVAVSIISIVINPLLYRAIGPISRWTAARTGAAIDAGGVEAAPRDGSVHPAPDPRHRAVVVGYGPTGRTVSRLLAENGVEPVIIELNVETVRQLREEGVTAVFGDSTHRDTLLRAGVRSSGHLILTSALESAEDVIRTARELNPAIHVLARTVYLRDVYAIQKAGAQAVFSGEGEVAFALTEAILHRLGATAEQIDRERARVHTDLFGGGSA